MGTNPENFSTFVDGEERPGLLFYGLCGSGNLALPVFPAQAWPGSEGVKEFVMSGSAWRVWLWELTLPGITASIGFAEAVEETLAVLLDAGCVVAWVALDGNFCDRPSLFLPECMSGAVFALMTASGKKWNSFRELGGWRALADDVLIEARAEAHPLAAAEAQSDDD